MSSNIHPLSLQSLFETKSNIFFHIFSPFLEVIMLNCDLDTTNQLCLFTLLRGTYEEEN